MICWRIVSIRLSLQATTGDVPSTAWPGDYSGEFSTPDIRPTPL
jgi:hypothetical protein